MKKQPLSESNANEFQRGWWCCCNSQSYGTGPGAPLFNFRSKIHQADKGCNGLMPCKIRKEMTSESWRLKHITPGWIWETTQASLPEPGPQQHLVPPSPWGRSSRASPARSSVFLSRSQYLRRGCREEPLTRSSNGWRVWRG